jgi:hypothetical protein
MNIYRIKRVFVALVLLEIVIIIIIRNQYRPDIKEAETLLNLIIVFKNLLMIIITIIIGIMEGVKI